MGNLARLIANPPEGIEDAAVKLVKVANDLPTVITEIRDILNEMLDIAEECRDEVKTANCRLVEISLGLDNMADPVKRPAFRAEDVQAIMEGKWPPVPEGEQSDADGTG
jgi:hypothetical protein